MSPERVQLLPNPEQYEALRTTVVRANVASNAARVRLAGADTDVRSVVIEEMGKLDLPAALAGSIIDRVGVQRDRFRQNQALVLAGTAVSWPAVDRVTLATAAGRRTVRVRVPLHVGELRPRLAERPVALTVSGDDLYLVAAD